MTAQEIIASGLVESYCLGFVSSEEKLIIEFASAKSPLLAAEIAAQRQYFDNRLVKQALQPSPTVKISVMQRVYRMQASKDQKFLPLIDEKVDWKVIKSFALANHISEDTKPPTDVYVQELPSTPEISNFVVWSTGKNQPEIHHDVKEFIVILKGSCNMYVDGKMQSCNPGDIVQIPLHKSHYAEVTSEEPMCALVQRQRVA